jgi:hypothetical protein
VRRSGCTEATAPAELTIQFYQLLEYKGDQDLTTKLAVREEFHNHMQAITARKRGRPAA